jgi:hypothetical protein
VNSSVPPPAGSLSARLGSQSYAIPPASYTQDQKDQRDISARLAEHPGFSLGDVGVSLGVGHDEKHTAEDWRSIADAHTALQKDNAPDKTNKPQLVTDDQGKLTFVGQDADGKPVVTPVTGAKGKSRESMKPDDDTASPKDFRKIQSVKDQATASASTALTRSLAGIERHYQNQIDKKPAADATDDDNKLAASTALKEREDARMEAISNYRANLQAGQNNYEQAIAGKGGTAQHYEYPSAEDIYKGRTGGGAQAAPPQQGAQPTPQQQPAKAAPAAAVKSPAQAAPKKVATTQQLQGYAKQKGIPLSQAVNEFKQSGYQVQ